MPAPSVVGDFHVDALATNISILYANEQSAYVADKVFPLVPVAKQSNKYASYPKEYWFRNEAQLRAPATPVRTIGFTVDTSNTYFCDNYALGGLIADEERDNYDQPFDPDRDLTFLLVDKLLMQREVKWATDFFTTSVWGTDVVGGAGFTVWSDYANSDPIANVETGRDTIHLNTAVNAKRLLVGRQVWTQLKHHPDYIERIKYTQRGVLTEEIVAAIMGLDKIIVGDAIQASTDEHLTLSTAYIFGKNALLYHVPNTPGLRTPAAGYTFYWKRHGGMVFMRRLRDDKLQADQIEGHMYYDQKVVGSDLGYFFSGAVT